MVKHIIDVDEETNRKMKYVKGLHDLRNVSQVIERLALNIEIPQE